MAIGNAVIAGVGRPLSRRRRVRHLRQYTPVFLAAGAMAFLASGVLILSHRLAATG